MLPHAVLETHWSICNFTNLVSALSLYLWICISEPSVKDDGHAWAAGKCSSHRSALLRQKNKIHFFLRRPTVWNRQMPAATQTPRSLETDATMTPLLGTLWIILKGFFKGFFWILIRPCLDDIINASVLFSLRSDLYRFPSRIQFRNKWGQEEKLLVLLVTC